MNHNSPAAVRAELDRLTVEPKKRWGQNFMVNPRTRRKLIESLQIGEGETVWEIGPGLGALTTELVPRCATLILFEIDHGLIRHLSHEFADHARVRIVAGDFLRTWQQARADHGAPDRVIGNLPYRSASAIIAALVEHDALPAQAVFTVQKELAYDRNYSSFSVLCQCLSEVRSYGELAPGTFYPAPEVTSAVIGLRPGGNGRAVRSRDVLFALIRSAFQARRKTLRNNSLRAASGSARRSCSMRWKRPAWIPAAARRSCRRIPSCGLPTNWCEAEPRCHHSRRSPCRTKMPRSRRGARRATPGSGYMAPYSFRTRCRSCLAESVSGVIGSR